MVVKQFTDEKYVAMSDIANLGSDIVSEIASYRKNYIEMVEINDLDFVNLIETPSLIKKRFIKNVELKGQLEVKLKSNDYILEIAKLIANGKDVPGVVIKNKVGLIKKFEENNKDLTIITNYLTNNIQTSRITDEGDIDKTYPELTQWDVKFLKENNNIKLNYSIQDYQELTNVSYETGRKALERMTELDFYEKKKVGKKFIYKPTDKLRRIMKGSE